MRNNILILAALLVLASCSQKQFSFRKTIKVNQPKQQELVVEESQVGESLIAQDIEISTPQETVVSESTSAILNNSMVIENQQQTENLSLNDPVVNTPQVVTKEKAQEEKLAPQKAESKLNKKSGGDGSTAAILGFIFGLVGLIGMFVNLGIISLLSLLLLIAGLVLSIVGLKSDNRGLALVGLIASIVGLVIWLILIVLVASFISSGV